MLAAHSVLFCGTQDRRELLASMLGKAELAAEERRKLEAAEAGRRQVYGLVLPKSGGKAAATASADDGQSGEPSAEAGGDAGGDAAPAEEAVAAAAAPDAAV